VWKKGTALVPSWTAFAVVQLLETHFGDLIDYDFTANMESDLDAIAHGGNEAVPWLTDFYFGGSGDHAYGLHKQIETQFPDINARAINSITVGQTEGDDGVVVRVGRYGPYVDMGEKRASVPTDLAPDELTTELALELIERQNAPDRVLGTDPETGKEIVVKDGRYGPYVQLGQPEPPPAGKKRGAKPRTSSLFKTMDPRSVTLDEALDLLSIPRSLGEIEGEEVVAYNGRFGPYLKRGDDSRSLQDEGELLTVTLEQAVDLFSQPKRRGRRQQRVLRELGENKENGTTLKILDGRYGPYVTDGTTNASIPRGREPETVKVEEAVEWLRARADAKR
jgi:DNA topoisomerase-1